MLSHETSTAQFCAEDQILQHLILRTRYCAFVLKNNENIFLKSGNQQVKINH